jgi:hypothetical protein
MRKLVLVGLVVAVAGLISAAPASASGPAAAGKEILSLNCEGLGSITVSVATGENSNGAGQIVGSQGHGIPVSFTFTATDVTTGVDLFSDTFATGKGHAHPNQSTVACTFEEFEVSASEFFGSDPLPIGVAPTDTIRGTGSVDVILKP